MTLRSFLIMIHTLPFAYPSWSVHLFDALTLSGPEFKLPSWMKPKGGFMKGGATITDTMEIDINQKQLQQQRPLPPLAGLFQLNLMRFKGFGL